jgi:O-antigen ligase
MGADMTPVLVARRTVLVALAAAPVVFVPPAGDIFGLPKLLVVALGVAVAAGAVALAGDRARPRLAPLRVRWFLAAFLAAQVAAALASIDRWTSFLGAYERYGGVLPLFVHVGLGVLVVVLWAGEEERTWELPAAMAVGGAVLATYVLCQVAGIDAIDWVEKSGAGVRYQAGTMGNSNFAAGYLGVLLPLLAPLVRRAQGRARVAVALLGVECVVALVATKGRGGLLAAVLGALALVALVRPWTGRDQASRRRNALVGGAVLVLASMAGAVLVTTTDVLRTESFDVRRREWAGAVGIFLERPLLGTGQETFFLRYPPHRTSEDGRALGLQIADKPHNVLLELASGTGIVGLLTFLALVVSVLVSGVRALGRVPEAEDRLLPAAFLAAVAAYVAQSLFSFDVPGLAPMLWVALAGVVVHSGPPALGAVQARRSGPGGTGGRPATVSAPVPGRWPWVTAAAAGLAVVVSLAHAQVADLAAGRSLAVDGAPAVTSARRAFGLRPHQPAYALLLGGAAESAAATTEDEAARRPILAEALAAYRRGIRQQPENVLLLAGLARTTTLVARSGEPAAFEEADAQWGRVLELDPYDWELHRGYGLMLNSWANATGGAVATRSAAADELRRTVDLHPLDGSTWSTLALVLESLGRHADAAAAARRGADLSPGDPEARALADRLTSAP